MMKRVIFFVTVLIFATIGLAAQESQEIAEAVETETSPAQTHTIDFVLQFTPAFYLNPGNEKVSGPSPVITPITMGLLIPNKGFLAFQPTLSFFSMNHLWYDGNALPAEIENRTSTTLSFLLTLPAVLTFDFKQTRIQLMPGIGIMARFAILANNVKSEDSGYTGSAGSDLEEINKWFWSDGRFFYLTSEVSWLFNVSDKIKAGPVAGWYFPVVAFTKGKGFQGTIFSIGMKLSL